MMSVDLLVLMMALTPVDPQQQLVFSLDIDVIIHEEEGATVFKKPDHPCS